jgi:hypothetical protein
MPSIICFDGFSCLHNVRDFTLATVTLRIFILYGRNEREEKVGKYYYFYKDEFGNTSLPFLYL